MVCRVNFGLRDIPRRKWGGKTLFIDAKKAVKKPFFYPKYALESF